ncbi:MAG: 3-isopropylmalate dehydratase small subunit [Gemmatimonadales bacterium]
MIPFTRHRGQVAVLPRANVDTDQIIPKQFLKRVERTGFGPFLFHAWRYRPDRSPNPEFELNRPTAAGASVLITGPNFGCGSSREHAVWALLEYGFRVILAPSFADIFYENCCRNGLLPVVLLEPTLAELAQRAALEGYQLTVDLEAEQVHDEAGLAVPFRMDAYRRELLLLGLDEIAETLRREDQIAAYERRRAGAPIQ